MQGVDVVVESVPIPIVDDDIVSDGESFSPRGLRSENVTGRSRIDVAFGNRRLKPNIVLDAIDSDVIKTYVGLGMGVGIVAQMAVDKDGVGPDMVMRPAGYLFGSNIARVAFKRGAYLRLYVLRFAELLSPNLSRDLIAKAMAGDGENYGI